MSRLPVFALCVATGFAFASFSSPALAAPDKAADEAAVAALDIDYQAAVKKNDAATMARLLADDFVLVTGRGQTYVKADLLDEAKTQASIYERQDASQRRVRVYGDTAVVTALLWCKGTRKDGPFDYKLWFSDTYVRTPSGWRYVFGQAAQPLPAAAAAP